MTNTNGTNLRTLKEEADLRGITHSRIVYGYPSSDLATMYGYGDEGCYVVVATAGDDLFADERSHLSAFGPDKTAAERYAAGLVQHGIARSAHDVGPND